MFFLPTLKQVSEAKNEENSAAQAAMTNYAVPYFAVAYSCTTSYRVFIECTGFIHKMKSKAVREALDWRVVEPTELKRD